MVPLRLSDLSHSTNWPKYIIIHHTSDKYGFAGLNHDAARFQTGLFQRSLYSKTNNTLTNLHVIVDRIGNDFYPIFSQPLFTKTNWEDLSDDYNSNSIHIGVIGNYNEDIPMKRLYFILAYRVICPFIRLFKIKDSDIFLHNELSSSTSCPGEFFSKLHLIMAIRKYRKFSPIYARK